MVNKGKKPLTLEEKSEEHWDLRYVTCKMGFLKTNWSNKADYDRRLLSPAHYAVLKTTQMHLARLQKTRYITLLIEPHEIVVKLKQGT